MKTLRWEDTPYNRVWDAFSGTLGIGFVTIRDGDGTIVWRITAVHMKWIAKGEGEAKSVEAAKKAFERAWGAWLKRAGLTPDQKEPPQ